MARPKRVKCVKCGKECKSLSKKGLCNNCSFKNLRDSIEQLSVRAGPHYEKWKKGYKKFADSL